MKQMLNSAIVLAARHHDGQFDKSGMPYIMHVMKVMHYTKSTDEVVMCVAVLHDVVEDTSVTFDDLYDAGMTSEVVDAVRLLTKVPGQKNEEYLAGILTNEIAMIVKMADLRHNMDIRRLKGISEKDMKRLEKYAKMYTIIEQKMNSVF